MRDDGSAGEDNVREERGLDSAIIQATEALDGHGLRLPVEFTFCWRDRPASAAVIAVGDGIVMRLRMQLGALPYTAEDPSVRNRTAYVMSRQRDLPIGRFGMDGRQTVLFLADVPIDEPLSGTAIVTAVVRTLLRVSPYLELAQPR